MCEIQEDNKDTENARVLCAVVETGKAHINTRDCLKILPEGYSILGSVVEDNQNSAQVADLQVRSDGKIVLYPRSFDTTGSTSRFVRLFEEKNGNSKFTTQSDA